MKPWYTATRPASAPQTDLALLRDIVNYGKNDEVSKIAANHLWHLHNTTVGLAFFDTDLSVEEKRKMVQKLQAPEPKRVSPWKRYVLPTRKPLSSLKDFSIADFVNQGTLNFFKIMKMDTEFLKEDPTDWPQNHHYQEALQKVEALQVINDVAERGVALLVTRINVNN